MTRFKGAWVSGDGPVLPVHPHFDIHLLYCKVHDYGFQGA
jgi:hypothetical protein